MPEPPSLKDPVLQLMRAKEHLNSLHAEIRMFHASEPCRVSISERKGDLRKIIHVQIPPPHERLGVIAGDVVNCLRNSLDHAMWQLALLTTHTPRDRTEFPCAWSFGKETEARIREAVKEVPPAAAEVIQSLQPYHRGEAYKSDPLWKIDKLSNIAKHRAIPLQGAFLQFSATIGEDGVESWHNLGNGQIVIVLTEEAAANVKLAPAATAGILLGSKADGVEVGIDDLSELHEYIDRFVFPKLTPFFNTAGIAQFSEQVPIHSPPVTAD